MFAFGARSWASLAILGVGAGGCDRLTTAIEDKAQQVAEEISSPEEQAPAVPQLTEDEQVSHKLDLYIECRDRSSQRIRDSWQRYDERVGEDGTPRKRDVVPYLYKIDTELTPCEDAVRKGTHMAPRMPEIEAAANRYFEYARQFAAITVELDIYYEDLEYENDDWATGKELAPAFAETFEVWSAVDQELERRIEARKEVIDRKALARVEERKGKNIEWHARRLVLAAKAFARCVNEPDADAEDCETPLAELEAAHQGFREYHDGNEAAAQEVFWMSSFEGSADTLLAAAGDAMQALRKGRRGTDEALARMGVAHDAFVSDSNNLRFER